MQGFIDKYQSYLAELEVFAPRDYYDFKKKRMLLSNIKDAEGVAHLIQRCRNDDNMSYMKGVLPISGNVPFLLTMRIERKHHHGFSIHQNNLKSQVIRLREQKMWLSACLKKWSKRMVHLLHIAFSIQGHSEKP